jgi:leucine-rich PPR motif-containing protein
MIGALLKGGRKEDAMDLFATIFANGLVPNVVTYHLIAENLIEEGSLEEFDGLFSAMELKEWYCSRLTYVKCSS